MAKSKKILFVGHSYYNHWYLSREMRKIGWKADVLNVEADSPNQSFYHGDDYQFASKFTLVNFVSQTFFYMLAIFRYDIFVFSGINYLRFGHLFEKILGPLFGKGIEIKFLKLLGKVIIYHNNGCRDGVLQSTFSKWGPYNVCAICPGFKNSSLCSDESNKAWGEYRNKMADYQLLLGGNRADFNVGNNIIEAPWSYSLDKNVWSPKIMIPTNFKLPISSNTVKLYHSVGNFDSRKVEGNEATIKSTHIYLKVVEELRNYGYDIEMIFFKNVPNREIVYYMAQSDIVLDMLTFGFFGANVREALMMGKPVICFLRPEWMATTASEIPEFVEEMPVISATPDTIKDILIDLIIDKNKREDIGRKSREFAIKWFASDNAAKEADSFFSKILDLEPYRFNKK